MCQSLVGWREVKVTEVYKKVDFAHCICNLVEMHFSEAVVIWVARDNLNIHTPRTLYEAFEPAEARRILRKLEFHYTPKHGSWLIRQKLKSRSEPPVFETAHSHIGRPAGHRNGMTSRHRLSVVLT